ncbi:MAG: hypothetical protein ACD_15C00178G0001 [uncultured bacterium]|nr:MAG: hypothetical protein ACD_15C00178G0001 [uncultured bacterium]HCU70599.1 hypothetical protein [Candidatus Moranbacteria bacterium]
MESAVSIFRKFIILTLVASLVFIAGKSICEANFWFSVESVLQEIKKDETNDEATKIVRFRRSFKETSIIVVRDNDGTIRNLCLDSNILLKYTFSKCEEYAIASTSSDETDKF